MALVSISEAAKLVRRNRSTIYRDIERGRLSKTVSPDGEAQIDTSELLRTYGRLHLPDDDADEGQSRDQLRIALLEERNRSLERALALEAELRKVKDQVTNELRARIADKESVIKVLESKVLFLEYDRQVESMKHQPEPEPPQPAATAATPAPVPDDSLVRPMQSGPAQTPAPAPAYAPAPAPATLSGQPQAEAAASPAAPSTASGEAKDVARAMPPEDSPGPGLDRSRVKVFHTETPHDFTPPHVPKMETMPPAAAPQAAPPKQRWWKMLIEKKKKPPLHK